jgi:hypothetical protein
MGPQGIGDKTEEEHKNGQGNLARCSKRKKGPVDQTIEDCPRKRFQRKHFVFLMEKNIHILKPFLNENSPKAPLLSNKEDKKIRVKIFFLEKRPGFCLSSSSTFL